MGGTSGNCAPMGAVCASAPVGKLATAKGRLPAACRIVRRDSRICSSPAKPLLCTAYSGLTTGQRRTFAGITETAGITRRPLLPAHLEGDMTEQPNRQRTAAD